MFEFVSTLLVLAHNGHMDWGDGWGVAMIAGMVLFWAVVIVGIVWIVREISRRDGRTGPAGGGDPLAILDRSLAEGTISPEQYRERRAILSERDQN